MNLTTACNPVSATLTAGTACVVSVGFVTANHTGATGWVVNRAIKGTSDLLSRIPGVEEHYAHNTAGALIGAACFVGIGKLMGALQSSARLRVYDVQGKLSTHQQLYTSHTIDQAIKTVKGLNPAERMKWGTNTAHYLKEMELSSGFKFHAQQKELLAQAMRTGRFEKLTPLQRLEHTKVFKSPSVKNNLIREWERKTGQKWPKYEADFYSKNGKLIGKKDSFYPAHHIIPQQFGGPHQWWNMKPLHVELHLLVHSAPKAPLKNLVKS